MCLANLSVVGSVVDFYNEMKTSQYVNNIKYSSLHKYYRKL